VNHSEMRLHGALCGLGVACVPDFVARESLARGDLVRVLPEWAMHDADVHWIAPYRAPLPLRLRLLQDFLAQRFAGAPWTAPAKAQAKPSAGQTRPSARV